MPMTEIKDQSNNSLLLLILGEMGDLKDEVAGCKIGIAELSYLKEQVASNTQALTKIKTSLQYGTISLVTTGILGGLIVFFQLITLLGG